jgi:hypothetical protein
MGAEPFKDMLMSMRFRFKEDEKIHAQTDLSKRVGKMLYQHLLQTKRALPHWKRY